MKQIKGLDRIFKDGLEYGIYEFCCPGCHVWTYMVSAPKIPAATAAAGGTQKEQRKLKHEKFLQWSWTTWQFSNPTQNSVSPTAAASSLLSPILIRRGVCTPPYQSPRTHKHICLLFIQPLLFHLHILCSALYILEEMGPYTSTDLLRTIFKLDTFTEELTEESEEKKEEETCLRSWPWKQCARPELCVQQLFHFYFYPVCDICLSLQKNVLICLTQDPCH